MIIAIIQQSSIWGAVPGARSGGAEAFFRGTVAYPGEAASSSSPVERPVILRHEPCPAATTPPMVRWDGEGYDRRFRALAESGVDVHGEANFVMGRRPGTVLDAGCGTGRVAVELARRGVDVVGVDADPSMIATAERLAPGLSWVEADVGTLVLDERFDVVVMAGNVPLFTPPGTRADLVAGCARHLSPGGALVCGFQLGPSYRLEDYDSHCRMAGLELEERWSTWDREPFEAGSTYAVSVHRLPAG